MGKDFSALLRRSNLGRDFASICRSIEQKSESVAGPVIDLWVESGYRLFVTPQHVWEIPNTYDQRAPTPAHPTLHAWLLLPGMFCCAFHMDSIYLYHPLRFRVFSSDVKWQNVMIDACRQLLIAAEGSDGLITYDESPIIYEGFWRGRGFADSMQVGVDFGAEEISSVSDFQRRLELEGNAESSGDLGFWRFSSDPI